MTTKDHLECTVKWPSSPSGPNSRLRRKICAAVVEHRDALLKEWDDKVISD